MITLRELSEIAGVSVSTVSKAINDSSDIGAETKQRIQQLAQQHGYVPPKRTVVEQKRSGPVIGLIYSDVTSNYYTRLIDRIDERIHEKGGLLIMGNASFDTNRIIGLLRYFQSLQSVDGVLIISALNVFGEIPRPRLPLVGISYPSFETHPFDYICVNDGVGIDEAVECLVRKGHTRIAFISEQFTNHRLEFFKSSLRIRHIEPDASLIRISRHRFYDAGYECMKEILAANQTPPTAVFGAYDDIAVGAAQAIREAGLNIPEDISLLGVDNTMQTVSYHRVLASVDCHMDDQADIALALLMKRINGHDFSAVQNVSLHTNFMPGGTIAPARDTLAITK